MNIATLKTSGRPEPFNGLRLGRIFLSGGMWFTKIDDMRGALITPTNQVTRNFAGCQVAPASLSCNDDLRICCVEWVELRGSVATLVRLPAAELPAWALNLYAPRPVIQRAKPRRPPLFAELRALIASFLRPAPPSTLSAETLSNLAWILARAGQDVANGATAFGGAVLSPEDDGNHILVDVRVRK